MKSIFLLFLAIASTHSAKLDARAGIPIGGGFGSMEDVVVKETKRSCSEANKGLLRLDGGRLQYCNGKNWIQVTGHDIVENSQQNPASTCKEIALKFPTAPSGMYWLNPSPAVSNSQPFLAYCEMKAFGGGWTMCYTTDERAKPRTEVTFNSNLTYGIDGYRSDCNNIPFTEIMFVDHTTDHKAFFTRISDNLPPLTTLPNYNKIASTYGLWKGQGTVSSSFTGDYQLLICDHPFFTGFMVSGLTPPHTPPQCYKQCSHWCGDKISPYFRTSSTSANYLGVAFNVNGHFPNRVGNKLMSVGLR